MSKENKMKDLQNEFIMLGFQKTIDDLKAEHELAIKAKDNRIKELEYKIELLSNKK